MSLQTQNALCEEPPSIFESLEKLKNAIWSRRPILKDIMTKHGGKTLYDYSLDFLDVNKTPSLDKRKHELFEVVEKLLKARLGEQTAKKARKQLEKLPLVSTADHHGPIINNPFWINSNIISALPCFGNGCEDLDYLIVFSFASVSANNASVYPRGIEFTSSINGSGNFTRIPFLPDKLKMGVVYALRGFTKEDIEKGKNVLMQKVKDKEVSQELADSVRKYIEEYFENKNILETPDLNSQITKINFKIWPTLFHNSKSAGKKEKIPDLIYLEIETIVTELLQKYHLENPDSLIYKLLFNKEYEGLVYKFFNKIPGAFSLENHWGTYMFWAIEEKKFHRQGLMLKDGKLCSEDNNYIFDYTPEIISKALKEKKIYPGMMLCYLLISLYYGMKCLGGFCQVNDLTMTKYAWEKFLKEVGENEEAEALNPVQTKELGGDGLVLSYLKTSNDNLINARGIDMILSDKDTSFERYVNLSKKLTLSEAMNPMLPEMYEVLYSYDDRDLDLWKTPVDQIFKATGLYKKLVEEMGEVEIRGSPA